MADLPLDPDTPIFYLYAHPTRETAPGFVLVNALTRSTDHRVAEVTPALREKAWHALP